MRICMLDVQPHQLFVFLHMICILSRSICLETLHMSNCELPHATGEIVTFQPQALYTEEETKICAMRPHIEICSGHQGFWPGIRSNISCIAGHFELHVKVMKRSGYPAQRQISPWHLGSFAVYFSDYHYMMRCVFEAC
ncbi:uncharacterized protein LOC123398424 [Hordeum vulgare subsp. vulgare]|uniref:uncharacterized protein LOC123398424 n=1 Tax=Hordeum vulgare subsp. vulgare TaxID=112509 RepID=UPI00162D581A|nr:uncharacterized protein LOC123398424 [Hordeum vulgare subsp. vulgare]XP_044948832.1 uncharacterized protein LOC123398424 [Hordeum vulgare subsp. vulgare]